jgi:cobalt-zinc-cadmium efflux system membrane fusion protein
MRADDFRPRRRAGGVKTERAGSATAAELIDMGGRIEITPEGSKPMCAPGSPARSSG